MRGVITLCLRVTVLCGAVLYAQEYRGRIQGTITDPSQAAVAGATVTLANVATNASTTRNSNQTGHYLFDMIGPGAYTLKVEMSGFAVFRAEGIVVQQRGDVTVDAVLRLSNVSETLEVSAQAAQVQFNTSRFETTVDSQLSATLPQYFRDPFFLSKTDPAVAQNDTRRENQPFYRRNSPPPSKPRWLPASPERPRSSAEPRGGCGSRASGLSYC